MFRLLAVNVFCSALGAVSAWAAEPASCSDAPNQMEMNICAEKQFETADAELNKVYGLLAGKLDAVGHRNLKAAERAWISFRDQECYLRTGYDTEHPEANGTIAPMLFGSCKTDLTKARTKDLQAQIKCPGGDLSCPP